MFDWWYASDGNRRGRVSQEELERLLISGTLGQNSPVWKKGMESWQAAGQVDELAHLFTSFPPDLPPELPEWRERVVGGGNTPTPKGAQQVETSTFPDFKNLFFGFHGRIGRVPFWVGAAAIFLF